MKIREVNDQMNLILNSQYYEFKNNTFIFNCMGNMLTIDKLESIETKKLESAHKPVINNA